MADALRIKICGLTDPAEARACADLGVWAIGLVFAPESSRRVSVAQAGEIARALPPQTARVGVFVDAAPAELAAAVAGAGLTHVQLHGVVDVAAARAAVSVPVLAGFAVTDAAALGRAERSPADLVLLDAAVAGRHGGTGRTFDWSLLAARRPSRPFVLAGGLTADNVAAAVAATRPWGVDVSSGVESAPGHKDPERVAVFVAAARQATTAETPA